MTLFSFELQIFKLINQVWTHPRLDSFFVFLTNLDKSWIMPSVALGAFLLIWHYKGRMMTIKTVVALLISVSLADLISYRIVKPMVNRPRPSYVVDAQAIVRVDGKGGYHGFTSNHAANSFAYSYILASLFPKLAIPLYLFAGLVAYSRVYVGVHFFGDVFAGALLGLLIASFVLFFANLIERRILIRRYRS